MSLQRYRARLRNSTEMTVLVSRLFYSHDKFSQDAARTEIHEEIRKHNDKWLDDFRTETVEPPPLE